MVDNQKQLKRNLYDASIRPGSFIYESFFLIARLASLLKLLRPNTKMHYICRDNWIFILTPLAGSSSLRSLASDVQVHNLLSCEKPKCCSLTNDSVCFVLDRNYEDRLTSFYNKKVRNPTSLSKARLLATCESLTWRTTPQEFVTWVRGCIDLVHKDKHLYTIEQITDGFGFNFENVQLLEIARDQQMVEALLGLKIGDRVNSTNDVAHFADPVTIPPLSS